MEQDVELICDEQGLAVLGEPAAVERFLRSEGLESSALGLSRLRSVATGGAAVASGAAEIAANSGRWVKLTKESAETVRKYGLRPSSKSGLSTGVVRGEQGQIRGFVEFVSGPQTLLSNPAVLSGAAGIMAQLAMQQAINEITEYLAAIEAKVDDVLRAQKDAVLARMVGAGFVIDEAMILRDARGRVDEVTWSKLHSAPSTIAETQGYALRQLDALAEKLEGTDVSRLAKAATDAQGRAQEWLAVLARCFQLQDAVAVLELDRVLDASPDELDGHRLGLARTREKRLDLIAATTTRLIERLDKAAGVANNKILFNPVDTPKVVHADNHVGNDVAEFHQRLGIEYNRVPVDVKGWGSAAGELGAQALEAGGKGVAAAGRLGAGALGWAKSSPGRVTAEAFERVRRQRRTSAQEDDGADSH